MREFVLFAFVVAFVGVAYAGPLQGTTDTLPLFGGMIPVPKSNWGPYEIKLINALKQMSERGIGMELITISGVQTQVVSGIKIYVQGMFENAAGKVESCKATIYEPAVNTGYADFAVNCNKKLMKMRVSQTP